MQNNEVVIEINLENEAAKKAVDSEVARLNEIRERRAKNREMLKEILEKDLDYRNLADEKRRTDNDLAVKKNQVIFNDPQAKAAQEKIEDLNIDYKAAKQRVSNALLNYWAKTNTTSIQATSGKVIEFERTFSIKNAQLKLFE